jgi:hypothetical protein
MIELKKQTQLDWRRHLMTESGIEGMLFLRERVPTIHKGLADEMIFEAGKAEGYKMALDTISEVIAVAQKREIDIENH